jgi:hypothetical protein
MWADQMASMKADHWVGKKAEMLAAETAEQMAG